MAYQNFFASAINNKRKTPAQISGKEVTSEFRMRSDGSSALVVYCHGTYDENEGTVTTYVQVTHPTTGELLFEYNITCPK